MRIFALETDMKKLTEGFMMGGEEALITVRFHGFLFFIRLLRGLVITVPLVVLSTVLVSFGVPALVVVPVVVFLWLLGVVLPLVTAFIDWRYDALIVTTEKIVTVNQSSIFHAEIRQMSLDNVASVHSSTQLWNMFPFGQVCFDLKEGTGKTHCLKYIPYAARVASIVSDAITLFQRRQAAIAGANTSAA